MTEDRSQRTEVRGQRSEVRSQKSEVRGQRTEDRRQKTDDRGLKIDDRGQVTTTLTQGDKQNDPNYLALDLKKKHCLNPLIFLN
jgi:hypothetical protein